jgi:hypothetical protein
MDGARLSLWSAAELGIASRVSALLASHKRSAYGADALDVNGYTPLHYAGQ